jgi:hypothetical protein
MKRIIFLAIMAAGMFISGCNSPIIPPVTNTGSFQKMYGGSGDQKGNSIRQTSDGGYIVAGSSSSTDINGVTNHGGSDFYVIKLDGSGAVLWQKMYGGSGTDSASSIQQTDDGGYIVAGYSNSTDISGVVNHGDYDSYIIKLNSSGSVLWQKMYGGSDKDYANSIQQTSDGGYIVAGSSTSTDISGVTNNGFVDSYVIKLDANGNTQWQKLYGGSGGNFASSIQQTSDGGYIVAGSSGSTEISGGIIATDFYVIKLDSGGSVLWQNLHGGSGDDFAYSIQETSDGGYIVAGYSGSTDISGVTNHGYSDVYMIKLDNIGTIEWQKMYGGHWSYYYWHWVLNYYVYICDPAWDSAAEVRQTSDGGYVIAGTSNSADISGVTKHSSDNLYDVYIIKLDGNGDIE